MSIMTKCPILPIMQIEKARFFRKAKIIYGEPVEFSEYYGTKPTEEQLSECDARLVEIMLKLRSDYLSEQESKKKAKKEKKNKK